MNINRYHRFNIVIKRNSSNLPLLRGNTLVLMTGMIFVSMIFVR